MTRVSIGIVAALLGAAVVAAHGAATPLGRDTNAKCQKEKVACESAPATISRPSLRAGSEAWGRCPQQPRVEALRARPRTVEVISRTPMIERLRAMSKAPSGDGRRLSGRSPSALRRRPEPQRRERPPPGFKLNPDGSITAVKDLGRRPSSHARPRRGHGRRRTRAKRRVTIESGHKIDSRYTSRPRRPSRRTAWPSSPSRRRRSRLWTCARTAGAARSWAGPDRVKGAWATAQGPIGTRGIGDTVRGSPPMSTRAPRARSRTARRNMAGETTAAKSLRVVTLSPAERVFFAERRASSSVGSSKKPWSCSTGRRRSGTRQRPPSVSASAGLPKRGSSLPSES